MKYVKPYSYDRKKYGHILDWDRHSLIVNGKRVFLMCGEFHYWRAPDRDRWRDLLLTYKAGGLNAVRIYYHWWWHCPSEEDAVFQGNRDLEYLFQLCTELDLYVLCAPGPYICAETSGGGFPGWLLAKRDVNIRHLKRNLWYEYDPKFREHSKSWLEHFLPIMKPHQITENPEGKVLALQIENEHIRKKVVQFALDQHMEDLSNDARELGATVPLFHNDALLMGSWTGGRDSRQAPVDLYGFDRYIVWCPREYYGRTTPKWKPADFEKEVAGTEKTQRGYGGWAAESPVLLAELQGGWFNQWGHDHGFDEIYDYYGEDFTRNIVESFMGEGSTIISLYMYYGGTNWGSLGDPDVYTSYDYSACIREFGFQSSRLRKTRLTFNFIRSFGDALIASDPVEPPALRADKNRFVNRHRRNQAGIDFFFLRNFSETKDDNFELTTVRGVAARGRLGALETFIAVGNLPVRAGGEDAGPIAFNLLLSAMPFVARMRHESEPHGKGELWIMELNEGELIFQGTGLKVEGDLTSETRDENTAVSFAASRSGPGASAVGRLLSEDGNVIYLLGLPRETAHTLALRQDGEAVAWGAYGLVFNAGELNVESTADTDVFHLGAGDPEGFEPAGDAMLPEIKTRSFGGPAAALPPLELKNWTRRPIAFDAKEMEPHWKAINIGTENDPLDHHYHSGHVAYRCIFRAGGGSANLNLNVRHRGMVWLNGRGVGGQITYGYGPMSAGAKNGPDPSWLGGENHRLEGLREGENELIILTESLGYNRGPFALNDYRNPRGVLKADISGDVHDEQWFIMGINTNELSDVFNTGALPGEQLGLHPAGWSPGDDKPTPATDPWATAEASGPPEPAPDRGLEWHRCTFDFEKSDDRRFPLRVRLAGPHVAHLFINDIYIGRYWGDFGPQTNFYLPDDLIVSGENKLTVVTYTRKEGEFKIDLLPYRIDMVTGNIDEEGPVFTTKKHTVKV